MEPLAAVVGAVLFLLSWYEELLKILPLFRGIKVHILRAYYQREVSLSSDKVFAHSLTISFLVQNLGKTDIAVKSVNISYLNKKEKIDLPHSRMYPDNILSVVPALIALVPGESSKNIDMNFFASYSKVNEEKRIKTQKLCLEVTLADGKKIVKSFYLDQ